MFRQILSENETAVSLSVIEMSYIKIGNKINNKNTLDNINYL